MRTTISQGLDNHVRGSDMLGTGCTMTSEGPVGTWNHSGPQCYSGPRYT